MAKLLKLLGVLVGAVILLGLLGVGWLVYDGHHAREQHADYVALGSSFAAGPGVAAQAPDAPRLCGQSTDNFAHLLARKRQLRLLDRSCGGSTTADILRHGQLFQTPQIDAVRATTRLVTVTTGGNDLNYLGGLWTASCRHQPGAVPWWLKAACKSRAAAATPNEVAASMGAIAREVHRRAPRATLVFIDYTTILPEGRGCPGLPLSEQELADGREVGTALARATLRAAQDNGAILIKASELTRGHDVCAADPWVFGWVFPRAFLGFGPYAYHPNANAMATIAGALDQRLPRR